MKKISHVRLLILFKQKKKKGELLSESIYKFHFQKKKF